MGRTSRDLTTIPNALVEYRHLDLAMTNGLENSIIHGKMIAGQSVPQGLATAPSTTQKHDLGTRMTTRDGRTFYYAKAGATLNTDLGCMPFQEQEIGYNTIAAAAVLGATSIVLDVGAGDGIADDGVVAVDSLINGYVLVFPHSSNSFMRLITANTVVAGGGGEMTLTLLNGIPAALAAGNVDHGEAMASPYADVRNLTSTTTSVLGIPSWAATAGQYLWIQTWGPVWIAPQGAVSTGNNDRQVVFRHDGSVDQHDSDDVNVELAQHAGYVMKQGNGGGQGAPFIMLQISP